MAAGPALAVAPGLMVNTILAVAAGQGPAGSFVVIVNVTEPAEISDAEGVYVGLVAVELLNEPLPLVVQVSEDAPPPIEPANVYVLPAHIAPFTPALAVATGLMVRTNEEVAAGQGPAGSFVVMVSVTVPAEISAADGV